MQTLSLVNMDHTDVGDDEAMAAKKKKKMKLVHHALEHCISATSHGQITFTKPFRNLKPSFS